MGKGSKPKKSKRHPLSAARPRKATTRAGRLAQSQCAPTPELMQRLKEQGATCRIQWVLEQGVIDQQAAQAIERFAQMRRLLGVAEYHRAGVLARRQPQTYRGEITEKQLAYAKSAYAQACAILDKTPGAFDAVTTLCDQRLPYNMAALMMGAAALSAMFVHGDQAA